MKNPILLLILCSLILLFTYTAISKWLDMPLYLYEMHNQPFPRWFATLIAWVLPVIEFFVVILLLLGMTRLTGLWIASMLMGLFTLYTLLVLTGVFHRIPCSCGGIIQSLTWPQHLSFNLVFTIIAGIGIRLQKKSHSKHIHA